jgi:hypothetical protein
MGDLAEKACKKKIFLRMRLNIGSMQSQCRKNRTFRGIWKEMHARERLNFV